MMMPWNEIKRAYQQYEPDIMAAGPHSIDPYILDWGPLFTPIEVMAWSDIRCTGTPLYPQYPVAGVFVDFGNPWAKVALELDGKAYHLDVEKDRARDARLLELGWHVYRVPGRESFGEFPHDARTEWRDMEPEAVEREVRRWILETSSGVVAAIRHFYFRPHFQQRKEWHPCDEEWLAGQTLNKHRLVMFDIPDEPKPYIERVTPEGEYA